MGAKRGRLQLLNMHPWRNGLLTAGHQATIEETALWRAVDVTCEIDGMLSKRPGRQQYAQTIKQPDPDATDSTTTGFSDFLTGLAGFVSTDSSSGDISHTFYQGRLQTSVAENTGGENFTISYSGSSARTTWSFRFVFRGVNLSNYADGTTANTFAVRVGADATCGKEFAIWGGGMYYKRAADSKYTLVTDSEYVGLGGWYSIEIVSDDAGDTLVYVNETLVDTIASSLFEDVTLTAGSLFEFYWEVEGTSGSGTQYSTFVVTPMYNDVAADAFAAQPVVALSDFRYTSRSGSPIWCLLCAAGDYIYHDNMQEGAWRPLHPKQNSSVFIGPYRDTIMWADHNDTSISNLWQWNGFDDPELMDDAPFVRFFTEHQQRLWAVGDGKQLFYSADRQPNVWFSPSPDNIEDQFEVILNAGYLQIPSGRGNEFKAIFGDYLGQLVAGTRRGILRVSGAGLTSYAIEAVDQRLGVESPNAIVQVGNDLWMAGRDGITSLATTDQYGDLKANQVSIDIADLWLQHPDNESTLSLEYLNTCIMAYNQPTGLAFIAVPAVGDSTPTNVYVRNTINERWYGPWEVDARSMANVELTSPIREVIAFGDTNGRVSITDQFFKGDFGTDEYTMTIESAAINGRSLDPQLPGLEKTWLYLLLYVLPRGDWSFTIEYWVDSEPSHTKTVNQNQFQSYILGDVEGDGTGDMRLDLDPDGVLRSPEEMTVIPIQLDVRGKALVFKITQDGLGHDLPIQGVQLQFRPDGYEVDNAD